MASGEFAWMQCPRHRRSRSRWSFPNGFDPHSVIFGADRVKEGELYLVRDPLCPYRTSVRCRERGRISRTHHGATGRDAGGAHGCRPLRDRCNKKNGHIFATSLPRGGPPNYIRRPPLAAVRSEHLATFPDAGPPGGRDPPLLQWLKRI
jgi:hypothetical protein